jgi:hypothetical protein
MNPEMSHFHEDEEEALIERRMDQGVFNHYMGDVALAGGFFETPPSATPSKRRKRNRASRRGGRAAPDAISGADLSRIHANRDAIEHPVDPAEQAETNRRGREMLAAARRKLELENVLRRVEESNVRYEDPDYPDVAERSASLATDAAMQKLAERRASEK